MSATTVMLLRSASQVLGADKALAERLGIEEALLEAFLADTRILPTPLLLRVVAITLQDPECQVSVT